jgi:tRNA threonylcarbamoyl adenosine modification protein YjeE
MNTTDEVVELEVVGEQAMNELGATLASALRPGDVVLLLGDLGAGKTTLVNGALGKLSDHRQATSPTFALCHVYDSEPVICHVDCWRMNDERELADLALEEMLDDGAVALIEWGELARGRFGEDAIVVEIERDEPESRRVTVSGAGRAAPVLNDLRARLSGRNAERDR